MRLVTELLMRAYRPGRSRTAARIEDAKIVFRGLHRASGLLKRIDPSVPDIYKKRFRDANLFMHEARATVSSTSMRSPITWRCFLDQ